MKEGSQGQDTTNGKTADAVRQAAPRQGIVVQTERGGERHLNINGTTFRVRQNGMLVCLIARWILARPRSVRSVDINSNTAMVPWYCLHVFCFEVSKW